MRERFQNSCALWIVLKGGIFLGKMPLSCHGFAEEQFWNRSDRGDARAQALAARLRAK